MPLSGLTSFLHDFIDAFASLKMCVNALNRADVISIITCL